MLCREENLPLFKAGSLTRNLPALLCRFPRCFPSACTGPEDVDSSGCLVGLGGHTGLSRALGVGRLKHISGVFVLRSFPGRSCLGGQLWGLQQSTCNPSHTFFPQFLFHFYENKTKNQWPSVMVSVWHAGVFCFFLLR